MTTIAEAKFVGDFMVRDPVCALLWQPLSFVRQQMLAGSFSYLPLLRKEGWHFISDSGMARYLTCVPMKQRDERLAQTVQDAVDAGMRTGAADVLHADASTKAFFERIDANSQPVASPALVCRSDNETEIIGIITAYDLL